VHDRRTPSVGAIPSPLSLALSLLRGTGLSAPLLSRAPAPSLSLPHRPHLSARPEPLAHDLPAVDVPTSTLSPATTEPPRPFWTPRRARPPPLFHLRPLPSSLSLSRSTHANREPPPPLPTSTACSVAVVAPVPRPVRLAVSYSGHPSVCPVPLWSVRSALTGVVLAQPELRHRRLVTSLCLRRCPVPPALPLKVSNIPAPLFPCVLHWLARNCSPELPRATVSPPRHVQRPMVLPHRRGALGWVRQIPLCVPRPTPKPLVPRSGRSARLRRVPAVGPSGATAPMSAPCR
jgi:hypothetical protein